jgi:hypothetical protein
VSLCAEVGVLVALSLSVVAQAQQDKAKTIAKNNANNFFILTTPQNKNFYNNIITLYSIKVK